MPSTKPVIVSFYTPGSVYQKYAQRFKETTCRRTGMRTIVALMPDAGTWVENTCLKGPYVLRHMSRLHQPIVWIDIDGEVVRYPSLLANCKADFAIYAEPGPPTKRFIGRSERFTMPEGWPKDLAPRWFKSGTLYFAHTTKAMELLVLWCKMLKDNPRGLEQYVLQQAWAQVQPETAWLPAEYCWMRRLKQRTDGKRARPVIVHDFASTEMPVVRA